MAKKLGLPLAIGYSILLGALSLININDFPKVDMEQGDKIVHLVAYCFMFLVWFYAFYTSVNRNKKKSIFLAALTAIVFGIIIEVLQGTLTSTRKLDSYDIIANVIGISMGVLILKAYFSIQVKKI